MVTTDTSSKKKKPAAKDKVAPPKKAAKTPAKRKKPCSAPGCKYAARRNGVCVKHGAKVLICKVSGCSNQAKAKGGFCKKHAKNAASTPASQVSPELTSTSTAYSSWCVIS